MRRLALAAISFLLLLLSGPPRLAAQTGHDLFQQALVKERADGDLQGAIAIFERIAREYAQDRPLAARALVQMGRCYEKLGNADARRTYRRVVQEYPDQSDMVAQARGRLTALDRLAARRGPEGVVKRQLVGPDGPVEGGSPSPDGRYVAYTDWTTNNIAIRDLGTGEARQLTTTGSPSRPPQFGMDPAFSADGQYVAYEWHNRASSSLYDLRIVRADGSGSPRVLYDTAGPYVMGPAWSHDGKHIAVARYTADNSRTDLLWVSVADGSSRVLDSYGMSAYMGISFSPDDRYVVYDVREEPGSHERYDIRVAATDGSGARPLVAGPDDDRLLGWVPGTDWVLFLSNRSNVWGAWAVQVEDGRAKGEPRLVDPGMGQAWPRGFTSSGDLYYFLTVRWFTTRVAPLGGGTGLIDTANTHAMPGSAMTPEWSPDGTRLAYREELSDFQGSGYVRPLRIWNVATGTVEQPADQLSVAYPRWTPDGTSIVASAYDSAASGSDYHGGIYQVDLASGRARLLRPLPASPLWWMGTAGVLSHDGRSLLFVLQGAQGQGAEAGTEGRLVRRDLDSGVEEVLYRASGLLAQPLDASPDGQVLLFAVRDTSGSAAPFPEGGDRLMLMNTRTGQARELVRLEGEGAVESVTWSPDGRFVLYPRFTNGGYDARRSKTTIWRVPVDGGVPERLAEAVGCRGDVSPDGRRIAYTVGGVRQQHMVMENLREVLGR
jgi:Tol biopolymer transport system component